MQLKGLELKSSIRLSQGADIIDYDVDVATTSATIDPNFYSLLFFDLLSGNVTGADGGSAVTGVKFKIYDTDDALVVTANAAKLDWYEIETSYVSEAIPTKTTTLGADKYLRTVEIIIVTNDGGVDKETIAFSSTALGGSTFSTADGDGIKGIFIESTSGDLVATATVQFVIAK